MSHKTRGKDKEKDSKQGKGKKARQQKRKQIEGVWVGGIDYERGFSFVIRNRKGKI